MGTAAGIDYAQVVGARRGSVFSVLKIFFPRYKEKKTVYVLL